MHFASSAVAAALLVARVAAVGNAIVKNQCDFPIYISSVSNTAGETHTIEPNGEYSESFQINPSGGGCSLKVSPTESLESIAQFEYTLLGEIWYDLSLINGHPFTNYGVSLLPSQSGCPQVYCPPGDEICKDAYNIPTDNTATKACSSSANLVMIACGSSDNNSSPVEKSKPAPAPKPTVTAAEAETTTSADGGIGVYTTMITQVITLAAREPSAAPQPRAHQHHHRHADAHAHAQ